jgi:ChrR Cupin-like domain
MDPRFVTKEPTPGGSVYVKPVNIDWKPSQFEGIQIKVLYERPETGELTCLLKWEPGTTLPFHQHPELEQSFVLEGSFYDHDGICRAGEYVWRQRGHITRPKATKAVLFSRCTASQTSSATKRASELKMRRARLEKKSRCPPSNRAFDRTEAPCGVSVVFC